MPTSVRRLRASAGPRTARRIGSGSSPRNATYTFNFTATASGTIEYKYAFTMGLERRTSNGTNVVNPDKAPGNPSVSVRFPTIGCAG